MERAYLELAPASLFAFQPDPRPAALPPPTRDFSLSFPFNVSPELYNDLLDVKIPIVVALVYATTVWTLNRVNKRRKNKPWRLSRNRGFFYFVVVHNVALALYSGWTAVGMFKAIQHTVPPLNRDLTPARLADSLCKMSGPREFGSAVTFDPVSSAWTTPNRTALLLNSGPNGADVGRLWNEGLGYYGWLFYLSKFYEVIDTLIILAKGKKSSLLQTYHHAGAMICMWAGIRYMSPPIWMFVQINSFIHTVMYSYYTLSALGIRVPTAFKRTLTSMQIMQLVGGASYALLHLVVSYDISIKRSHIVVQEITSSIPTATSAIAAAITIDGGNWLKKLALRAAGEEGLARNIGRSPSASLAAISSNVQSTPEPIIEIREEIQYRYETSHVHCIDTQGQTFAILLNVLYLMPLTWLFVRFFVRSYVRRAERVESRTEGTTGRLRQSSTDAVIGISKEIREAMNVAVGGFSDHEFSGKTPVSSGPRSPDVSTGTRTPSTIKPLTQLENLVEKKDPENSVSIPQETTTKGRETLAEGAWFGSSGKASKKGLNRNQGARTPSARSTPRELSPSRSPSERRRAAEEVVRRAYEAAEAADRRATEDEADSIISVESTMTVESMVNDMLRDARRYEVTGVDEILDAEEVAAEQQLLPGKEPPRTVKSMVDSAIQSHLSEKRSDAQHNGIPNGDETSDIKETSGELELLSSSEWTITSQSTHSELSNETKATETSSAGEAHVISDESRKQKEHDEEQWTPAKNKKNKKKAKKKHNEPQNHDVSSANEALEKENAKVEDELQTTEGAGQSTESHHETRETNTINHSTTSTSTTESTTEVTTHRTVESIVSELRQEARHYEVSGVDEILDSEEVKAEEELQPNKD